MKARTSRRLIIFEGPDGAGKSTLAKSWAAAHGARYTHLGAFPDHDGAELCRRYVDAMLPAVLGHEDVAMDRCWISEPIYGAAFRGGEDRVGFRRRALERLAWRCQTTVIVCLPPYSTCVTTFIARKGEEYLERVEQLTEVWHDYDARASTSTLTSLPTVTFDPRAYDLAVACEHLDDLLVTTHAIPHFVEPRTAGNLKARVLLVGERFGPVKRVDPTYQWPFGSLSFAGCSHWLGEQLDSAGIGEDRLLWVNSDGLTDAIGLTTGLSIVALGKTAEAELRRRGRVPDAVVLHPQFWKRFCHSEPYPLVNVLKELLA